MEFITCAGRQERKIFLHEGSKTLEQVTREVLESFKSCLALALSNLLLLDLFRACCCTSCSWKSVSTNMIL